MGPEVGAANHVIVSTVDRYQGDENDIVILSLVRARAGNRFVALKNRFIVATSRARIGFYVIGSSSAVTKDGKGNKGPQHWCDFVAQLEAVDDDDSASEDSESSPLSNQIGGPRIGTSISICCPRHRNSRRDVADSDSLARTTVDMASLCKEPCAHPLKWCGHQCGMPCHDPITVPHTAAEECKQLLPRPCGDHRDVELTCGELFKHRTSSRDDVRAALDQFVCKVPVVLEREECEHTVALPCNEAKQIRDGSRLLEPCCVKVADYVHPICNHRTKSPTCSERRQWEQEPPQCRRDVIHRRACGCKQKMQCWQQQQEIMTPTNCIAFVEADRPRCSHKLSLRCHYASRLRREWDVAAAAAQGNSLVVSEEAVVEHGIRYGPSETEVARWANRVVDLLPAVPRCLVPVRYRAPCSHLSEDFVPCHQAFEWAAGALGAPACQQLVAAPSPVCGQIVQAPCHLVNSEEWKKIPKLYHDASGTVEMSEVALLEATPHLPEPIDRALQGKCSHRIRMQRRCGHTIDVPCNNIFKRKLPPCTEMVTRTLPCGHKVEVECQSDKTPPCMAPVPDEYVYPCGEHRLRPGTCHKLSQLRHENPACPEPVSCVRFRCGHSVVAPCHKRELIEQRALGERLPPSETQCVVVAGKEYCDDQSLAAAGPCMESVVFRGLCGHDRWNVQCHLAFKWADDETQAPPCEHEELVESPLCKHTLCVPCSVAEPLRQWRPWAEAQPWESMLIDIGGEEVECPELVHGMAKPSAPPSGVDSVHIRCKYHSVVNLACGHSVEIPCVDAVDALASWNCKAKVPRQCLECGHECLMLCCEKQQHDRAGTHRCENLVDKSCGRCAVNTVRVPCFKKEVSCNATVTVALDCGHEVSWQCGQQPDPRADSCRACLKQQWAEAVETHENSPVTMQQLHAHVLSRWPAGFMVLNDRRVDRGVADSDSTSCSKLVDGLRTSKLQVFNTYMDLIGEHNVPTTPPPGTDQMSYDVVFCQLRMRPEESSNVLQLARREFQPKPNRYGVGIRLTLLSADSILPLFEKVDEVTLCVGVAYRHRTLEGTPPFRRSTKADKSQQKKANKKAQEKRLQGFDCVRPMGGAKVANDVIFWTPGICVPVTVMTVRRSHACVQCLRGCQLSEGVACRGRVCHFFCNKCFGEVVDREVAALAHSLDHAKIETGLPCPSGCAERFSDAEIAQHVTDETFAAYSKTKQKLIEHRLGQAHEEEKKKLAAEHKRLEQQVRKQQQTERFPQYWGDVPKIDGQFLLKPLGSDKGLLKVLGECIQPSDPKQLGSGVDASGWAGIPADQRRIRLRRAWRVQNEGLWKAYAGQQQVVAKQMKDLPSKLRSAKPIKFRPAFESATAALPGKLLIEANEHYLLSGVPKDTIENVMTSGMNEGYSGANAGSMFGEGIYFAEDGAKIDQYTREPDQEAGGKIRDLLYQRRGDAPKGGVNYVFLCRVLLGCHVRTQDARNCMDSGVTESGRLWATDRKKELALIKDAKSPINCHSLLAEVGGSLRRFREVVVFHGARVYPEYLIAYSREKA